MEEELIEEVHAQLAKKEKSPAKKFLEDAPKMAIFVFGLALIILMYMVFYMKFPFQKAFLIVFVGVFVLWMLSQATKTEGSMLTEQECKIRLFEQLQYKQFHTDELPEGIIKIGLVGRLRHIYAAEGAMAWKREIAFRIIEDTGLEHIYSAEVNVYSGDIISVIDRPEGFDGKTAPDIKVVAGKDVWAARQYELFRGGPRRRI